MLSTYKKHCLALHILEKKIAIYFEISGQPCTLTVVSSCLLGVCNFGHNYRVQIRDKYVISTAGEIQAQFAHCIIKRLNCNFE